MARIPHPSNAIPTVCPNENFFIFPITKQDCLLCARTLRFLALISV